MKFKVKVPGSFWEGREQGTWFALEADYYTISNGVLTFKLVADQHHYPQPLHTFADRAWTEVVTL